jgi:hypothetical protein
MAKEPPFTTGWAQLKQVWSSGGGKLPHGILSELGINISNKHGTSKNPRVY